MEHNLALQGLRLMVVEDEPMAALEIQDMLDSFGCEIVGVASNVHRGLAFACNEKLNLDGAILDINLGGEQVYPVAERLKSRGVPFIFSTGYGRTGQAPSFAHIPTLNKPYGPDDLEEMLIQVFVSSPKRRGFKLS